jgi:hypothetical protein
MLTVLGVLLPYAKILSQASDILNVDYETMQILHLRYIINLVLAGTIAYITFKKSILELGSSD